MADRRVEFHRDRDGMAWIAAYLPADSATAIWNRTTAIARGLQGPIETRTLTQLKADEFARRLLADAPVSTTTIIMGSGHSRTTLAGGGDPESIKGSGGSVIAASNCSHPIAGPQGAAVSRGQIPNDFIGLAALVGSDESAADLGIPDDSKVHSQDNLIPDVDGGVRTFQSNPDVGKVPTPRADVLVTVPALALFGVTDEPATLDGYGPIPASMARKLVAEGADSFYRVLVDPSDGTPLEIGRTSYRLTKAMRQALRLRDGKCTFPGCNNPSLDNEADHLTAWEYGGTTGISNLAQLCPKHHRLKHNTGWTPTEATQNEPPGWTSPTGRDYASEQPDWEPPHLPPAIAALPGVGTASGDSEMHETCEDLVCPPWLEWGDVEITDADVPDPDTFGDAGLPDDPDCSNTIQPKIRSRTGCRG